MGTHVPITFEPAGVTVWVLPGTTVLEASRRAGIVVPAPCGGRGVCGSCGVRIVSGQPQPADAEEVRGLRRAAPGLRLACRARVAGPLVIRPVIAHPQAARATRGALVPLVAGVDLGTTSVAAVLIDSDSGREVARASVPNRQQSYGADVLSRMAAALDGSADDLRILAEESVRAALEAAAAAGSVDVAGIERLVIAGNTAMASLLSGVDVASLAVAPFVPPEGADRLSPGSAQRLGLGDDAEIVVLPPVSGFVGGDALAAALAGGMLSATSPILLVDFGTNAEIILAVGDRFFVTSAAAGPAFEGGGISCGGPAAAGGVERVSISDFGEIELRVIADEEPRWFSGAGLVSAIAALRRVGHIDAQGLMSGDGPLSDRFEVDADGVVLVRLGDPRACLSVSQLDVRAFQLAKAAVLVGILATVRAAGIEPADAESTLVAGAFGGALEPADLRELGVLPAGIGASVVRIGNAALDGAAVVALEPDLVRHVLDVSERAVAVEMATEERFSADLVAATTLAPAAT